MTRPNAWVAKMLLLIKSGNAQAAIAQIKVAPSAKDLNALKIALQESPWTGRWPMLDAAIEENIVLLSAPRLHRAP
jgi:hypothetical protein